MQLFVPKVSATFRHAGVNVRFIRGRTIIEEGHPILEGRENLVEPIRVDYPVSEPAAATPPPPPAPPAPVDPVNEALEAAEAVTTHAGANALAKKLGVDGFNDKTPTVAEKKAALIAKAKENA